MLCALNIGSLCLHLWFWNGGSNFELWMNLQSTSSRSDNVWLDSQCITQQEFHTVSGCVHVEGTKHRKSATQSLRVGFYNCHSHYEINNFCVPDVKSLPRLCPSVMTHNALPDAITVWNWSKCGKKHFWELRPQRCYCDLEKTAN